MKPPAEYPYFEQNNFSHNCHFGLSGSSRQVEKVQNVFSQGSWRRFLVPLITLKLSDFRWVIKSFLVSYSSRRTNLFSSSILWQKSQRRHPFFILVERDSEEIVCDNSMRFSGKTFIRMIKRVIKKNLDLYDQKNHLNSNSKQPANIRRRTRSLDSSFNNMLLD